MGEQQTGVDKAGIIEGGMSLPRDIHRIGGGRVENLRLTPQEMAMDKPGFSVLKADTADEAALQMIAAFPGSTRLLEKTRIVGSTNAELIRSTGFELMANSTRKFPNHFRVIHPDGIAGFNDENLSRLATVFDDIRRDEYAF